MQRDAGTPEQQMKEQPIKSFSDNNLPAILTLIHNVYTDSVIRRILPAKTGEAYREVCMMQAQ